MADPHANTLPDRPARPGEDAAKARALTPGERVGRFVLVERLGEGGMGQVFAAYDPELDRKVAIKFVRAATRSPAVVARVRQEAQAMAKVSHPNVVQVYETGELGGRVFIVMEIVDGTSLAEFQRARDLHAKGEIAHRLRVYLDAARGLLAAHRSGLIHRDFKPDNVLLGKDGRVRVADFGLARAPAGTSTVSEGDLASGTFGEHEKAASQRVTRAGTILGTIGYMSPEQVSGTEADERSDQFSFCATLYEALFGVQPFPADDFDEYSARVLSGPPRPLRPSEVPLVVEAAILRGLERDPAARFRSMQELIVALEAGLVPESEPLLTRNDKIRLGVGIAASLVVIEVTNLVVVALTGSRDSLVRGVAILGVYLAISGALLRWPPWEIRHRARYRGMMGFFLITLGTMLAGRVAALLQGAATNDYFTLECLMLAGLCAIEALRVGWQHGVVGLPPLIYAPFLGLLPELRLVLYNVVLAIVVIGSIFVHMRQPLPTERDALRATE